MAESLKDNIRTELLFASKHPNLNEWQKRYAKNLAKYLEDKDETEIRKILYASLHQGGTRGGNIRGIVTALGQDSDVFKTYVSSTPSFKTDKEKISESFKDVGGERIFDERSKKWWPINKDIDKAKVDAIAKNLGMTTNELYRKMEEESAKESSENISKGADIGGWTDSPASFFKNLGGRTFGFFRPRAQELIAEAGKYSPEEFRAKMAEADVLDAAENIAYGFNPVQRSVGLGVRSFGKFAPSVEKGIARIGKTGYGKTTLGSVSSAFVNPTLTEVADAIVYDEGPRSNISTADILLGSGINLSPRIIGSIFAKSGSFGGVQKNLKGRKALASPLGEIENKEKTKKTFKEFSEELEKNLQDRDALLWLAEEKGGVGNVEAFLKPRELERFQKVKPIFEEDKEIDEVLTSIVKDMGNKGISLAEATDRYFKGIGPIEKKSLLEQSRKSFVNERGEEIIEFAPFEKLQNGRIVPTKDFVSAIKKSSWAPVLNPEFFQKPLTKAEKMAKKKSATLEMLANGEVSFGLGKLGDVPEYASQIPLFGGAIESMYKSEEEKKKEAEEENVRKAYEFKDWSEVE